MNFKRIGVLGAGNIGISVVTDLVLHGITAVVVDVSNTVLKHAQGEVLNNIRFAPLLSKTLPEMWDPLESTCRHASLSIL